MSDPPASDPPPRSDHRRHNNAPRTIHVCRKATAIMWQGSEGSSCLTARQGRRARHGASRHWCQDQWQSNPRRGLGLSFRRRHGFPYPRALPSTDSTTYTASKSPLATGLCDTTMTGQAVDGILKTEPVDRVSGYHGQSPPVGASLGCRVIHSAERSRFIHA
jgi:hypothetical protein